MAGLNKSKPNFLIFLSCSYWKNINESGLSLLWKLDTIDWLNNLLFKVAACKGSIINIRIDVLNEIRSWSPTANLCVAYIIGFNHGVLGLAENPARGTGFWSQNIRIDVLNEIRSWSPTANLWVAYIIGFNHGVLGLAENPARGTGFWSQNIEGVARGILTEKPLL